MGLVQKAFSDIITFSRSSNATRVGPTGVLEYAPHNLLTYSEQFDNAAWTKTNTSVTANAIAAPDGTVTGETLSATATTNGHELINTFTASSGTTYTLSVYAKLGVSNFIQLVFGSGSFGVDVWANFNLSTGSLGTLGSLTAATITNVGNGWYRCTITGTATSSAGSAVVIVPINSATAARNPTFDGTGQSVFIWGAQLAVGPYALDYTPTTSAAVYGPRFDYDGSGVTIVEPVSTNLLLYSEQFENAAWTKLASTVTANSTTAPDGTLTADTVTGDGTNASHVVRQSVTLLPNTTYVCSAYAKANTNNFGYLFCGGTGAGGYSTFDYSAGSLGANQGSLVSRSITNAGNGWYRAAIVFTTGGTVGSNFIEFTTSPIDTGSSVVTSGSTFYWGAQLEVGSTATGYMVSGATNGFRAVPVVSGSATARGLLVEEQRTNLLTYSEQFDNAVWAQSFLTENITANSATSPNGQVTADTIADSVTTAEFAVGQTVSVTANVPYTFSIFAKANGSNFLYLRYYGNVEQYYYTVIFDLSLGTATKSQIGSSASNGSNTITSVGNGWYRLTVTATVNSGTLVPIVGIAASGTDTIGSFGQINVNGTGSRSCYIWGAQLE